jgi:hypothetical protein
MNISPLSDAQVKLEAYNDTGLFLDTQVKVEEGNSNVVMSTDTEGLLEYIKDNHGEFNALEFCQKFKNEKRKTAESAFSSATSLVAKRSMKTNMADKDFILLARKAYRETHIVSLFFVFNYS